MVTAGCISDYLGTKVNSHQQNLFETEPMPWELDDASECRVATVVFSGEPRGTFDYLVPERLRDSVRIGRRIRVPLGRGNRTMVGYCVEVEDRNVVASQLKEVRSVVDQRDLISEPMMQMAAWMSERYMSPWGQVLEAIVPSGVRGQAGTREMVFLSVSTSVAARLTQLKLPKKQAEALRHLAGSVEPITPPQLAAAVGCTQAPITALRKKGLVHSELRRVRTTGVIEEHVACEEHLTLNDDQLVALQAITSALDQQRHETILLHGVTGSGKTEVYIRAIDEVIRYGRQAIVLVPEISLTPQTRERFRSRFPRVSVLHSNLDASERHWHWEQISRGDVQVVVGARSAIFAPTPHLGLVVLDEEHDASFKQESSPRYHARDVALFRAKAENIPLVLGTATPSLESWYQTEQSNYQRVTLPRRIMGRPLPEVVTVDLRTEVHAGGRGAISRPLQRALETALSEDGQAILLLNRRGFSTHIQCPSCGHVVSCPDCDIALTHHREGDKAVCHYCDHLAPAPVECPECQFSGIRFLGLGTQRLETEVRARYPNASCLRMDSDTMTRPGSHEAALKRFREGEIQILIGTQMIAKGLDFPNVTLVGVVNADTALHFPDFRAAERTFQLVTQVAGRTGRGSKGGHVLVQTYSPDHPAIKAAQQHDYLQFTNYELPIREEYGYPPCAAMIRLVARGLSKATTQQFVEAVQEQLLATIDATGVQVRVLGPAEAPIAKIRGKFRFHMLLHGPNDSDLRETVRVATSKVRQPSDVQWIVDVDPQNML